MSNAMFAVALVLVLVQASLSSLAAAAITTSHITFAQGSSFSTKPLSKAASQRIASIRTLANTTLAKRASQCSTKPTKCKVVVLNVAKASKTTTVAKGFSTLSLAAKQPTGTIRDATVTIQDDAALHLNTTGLSFSGTSLNFLNRSWCLLINSFINFTKGLWSTTATQLYTVNSTVDVSLATVQITDTNVWSMNSVWMLKSSGTEIAWSAPKPTVAVSSSKPFLMESSILTVDSGLLRFKNVADAVIRFSTVEFLTCTVELVNSQLTIINSNVKFGGSIVKLTNSKLILTNVKYTGDKFLRNVFNVPLPKPTYPFTGLDKLKPVEFTVPTTGNFSVQTKATWNRRLA